MTTTASSGLSATELASGVKLYSRTVSNKIGVTAWTANHIGYLDKNKTQLEVRGTITGQCRTAMYAFMFRKGDTMRGTLTENTGEEGCRVQIMDSNGRTVLADSGGTNATLKANYAKLTSGTLDLVNGNYILKVTHDVSKQPMSKTLNYTIKLSSGTTYKDRYKTSAGAQTLLQYYRENGTMGYSVASMSASFLTSTQNGDEVNLFDYLA